ncbi:adenylate kinase isoenzyme 5 isoform X2 [Periplaneta americana]|uniref:adenylate kinase isoenzyme 5 isoform X2 n=1 Tax=Periplaneta americana TaxID=6978 RepID=UPI0037E8A73D
MGICLDTEQQNGSQVFEGQQHGGREAWGQQEEDLRFARTPPDGQFPMQNGGHVKFEVPKVPVIFVLGGPGSGKVTHCDNLMQEKRGITHINMTDLLQQYAIDMKDFGQLSSKTVTEVLMLEMKMAPAAKTYLVSGYPRNMRDVVEYSEKIQVVNGVILVSWRQKVLERQIDYGAKLGHVVLSLAKMELNNFYKNVMPVADYFDQRGMLYAVNGERNPSEVYKDFRSVVLQTLGMHDQGTEGPAITANVAPAPITEKASEPAPSYKAPAKGFPPVIWVIGGPGSNKSALCQKAVRQAPGWVHFSVGRLLRATAETTDPHQGNDSHLVRQAISSGEMVPQTIVLQLVESQMTTNMSAQGILMDGFPRDMNQVYEFENKFKQQPVVILLDCSKLQLGRGRLDDSVAAFRRRLELFRELSLPMLKTLDNENRLTIVDGDTDTPAVQEDFNRVVLQQVEHLKRTGGMIVPQQPLSKQQPAQQLPPIANGTNLMIPRAGGGQYDSVIHDLESDDGQGGNTLRPNGVPVNTISRQVAAAAIHHAGVQQIANGGTNLRAAIPNGVTAGVRHMPMINNMMEYTNITGANAPGNRPSRDTIRDMYANVESYPMDAHL